MALGHKCHQAPQPPFITAARESSPGINTVVGSGFMLFWSWQTPNQNQAFKEKANETVPVNEDAFSLSLFKGYQGDTTRSTWHRGDRYATNSLGCIST